MNTNFPEFDPPSRILMGPGPSDVSPRVLSALARPTVGHLDPEYLRLMDTIRELLRSTFKTSNELTLATPGTGTSGMEACLANLIEPGDEVIVGVAGYFGARMADMAGRFGAEVHVINAPWGEVIETEAVARTLAEHPRTKVVGIVHAETSTGSHQPIEEISSLAHEAGALLLVDTVTSLGCMELRVDDWGIDAAYSCSQKGLSCPPGLAPVTFSSAAVNKIGDRATKPSSWYLDVGLLAGYWGPKRVYHHTSSANLGYALYEGLRMVAEEGLEARWARHLLHHRALRAGLEAIGLEYIPSRSLPNLNAVRVPDGVDDLMVRQRLLADFDIEIGAGLGPFAGKAWRIGIMGSSCTRRNVIVLLGALETILGHGGAVAAAGEVYRD